MTTKAYRLSISHNGYLKNNILQNEKLIENKNNNIMQKSLFTLIAVLTCATTIFATEGALKGKFTINDKGDQIVFSQGNLQYVGKIGRAHV